MTRAMKWAGSSGSTNNVGSVEYQYCLACDGALSKRFVYAGGSGASRGALQSGQRYEYDGLNLLRVDELYGSTLSESGPWRTVEISTHQPGQLGALLHKRVYEYSSATSGTPSQTKDFTYSYDPVGNVYSVFDANGNEAYYFTQDAFGNELPITTLGGDDWDDARDDRIVEHQTGKWIDEFTELYYFSARWYSSEVGRFVGRDPKKERQFHGISLYVLEDNDPINAEDIDGKGNDYRDLVKKAKRCGLIVVSGTNHEKVLDAEGKLITTIPRHAKIATGTLCAIEKAIRAAGKLCFVYGVASSLCCPESGACPEPPTPPGGLVDCDSIPICYWNHPDFPEKVPPVIVPGPPVYGLPGFPRPIFPGPCRWK